MLLFKNQSMALPFKDNDVTLYTSGYAFFPALLHAISLAQHHIHIDIFIFEDDELGNIIADALIDRARHGVEGARHLRRCGLLESEERVL